MDYFDGILINYINGFPNDLNYLFEAIKYIIESGTGSNVLDSVSKKNFKDTNETYFNRIKNKAISEKDCMKILFNALFEWYETWKDIYLDFNTSNAQKLYTEKPIHTWLHCLLTGKMEFFNELEGNSYVIVRKNEWDRYKSVFNKNISYKENSINNDDNYNTVLVNNLLEIYKRDESLQIREMLLNKKIAIFSDKSWSDEIINELKLKYLFKDIIQLSSIEPNDNIGHIDYAIFLTARASHTSKYKLESKMDKANIFLVNSTNEKKVIQEFLVQLRGRLK